MLNVALIPHYMEHCLRCMLGDMLFCKTNIGAVSAIQK